MKTYLALLRGINVSGKNKILKQALQALFTDLNFKDVVTYIQSGNVVFKAKTQNPTALAELISLKIAKTFQYNIPVIVKTVSEMRIVINQNPFLKEKNIDLKKCYVVYLNAIPNQTSTLIDYNIGNDKFKIIENILYIKYDIGAGKTKLSNTLIEKKLKLVATTRNWRTTTKLLELMEKE